MGSLLAGFALAVTVGSVRNVVRDCNLDTSRSAPVDRLLQSRVLPIDCHKEMFSTGPQLHCEISLQVDFLNGRFEGSHIQGLEGMRGMGGESDHIQAHLLCLHYHLQCHMTVVAIEDEQVPVLRQDASNSIH